MPKRLPYEILMLGALALGSCSGDGPALRSHDDIEAIASDVATDAIADSSRISDPESRIEDIESKLNM